jgi:hypothetical protein
MSEIMGVNPYTKEPLMALTQVHVAFNGKSVYQIHACSTKAQARTWMNSNTNRIPKGHTFLLVDRKGEASAHEPDNSTVIPAGWRAKSNKWETQPGKQATNFSTYVQPRDNRRA